jgi:biopolymer transport protein ExbD
MAGKLLGGGYDRYRLVQNADINVTPFVDIMLVLLIIFMIALPVAQVSLKLDLPPAGQSDGTPPTVVTLRRDGVLVIGETPTSLAHLSGDLSQALGGPDPKARRVYVRAETGVRYGAFVQLVSQLHHDGFHAVGLVNEEVPS